MLEATKSRGSTSDTAVGAVPVDPALAAESKIARIAVTVFPLLVVVAGVAGYLLPGAFKPLGPTVPYLLGIIMFCMGLTLTPPDFPSVAKRPGAVVLGIVAHYVIVPGAGWLIAVALNLPPELAVGLILVGCAPWGTASNVMAFLAKGDVALSVAVASVSTLIAPVVTPLLVWPWCCTTASASASGICPASWGAWMTRPAGRWRSRSACRTRGSPPPWRRHFSPLTALPSAVFSLWHNISGAMVAAWLARRPLRDA